MGRSGKCRIIYEKGFIGVIYNRIVKFYIILYNEFNNTVRN